MSSIMSTSMSATISTSMSATMFTSMSATMSAIVSTSVSATMSATIFQKTQVRHPQTSPKTPFRQPHTPTDTPDTQRHPGGPSDTPSCCLWMFDSVLAKLLKVTFFYIWLYWDIDISKCSYKRLTIALQCLSQGYYKTQPLLITLWYKVDFLSSGLLLFHEGQAESHQRQESGNGWRKISQQFFSRERNILSLPPLCHLRSDLFKNHIALLSDDNFCKSIKIHIIEHFCCSSEEKAALSYLSI